MVPRVGLLVPLIYGLGQRLIGTGKGVVVPELHLCPASSAEDIARNKCTRVFITVTQTASIYDQMSVSQRTFMPWVHYILAI